MKHAIIIAHPRASSFTASVAIAYGRACTANGHDAMVRDLYRMQFDPCMKAEELPFDPSFRPGPDVTAERELLKGCDVYAFFYPLWLNAPPAMLKGYLDRVFGFGFAYGAGGRSYNPLLTGRKLISFSSSGAPAEWLQETGSLPAVKSLFDRNFADLCGMTVVDHVHVGNVTPGASSTFIKARLQEVEKTVMQHFGRQTCH